MTTAIIPLAQAEDTFAVMPSVRAVLEGEPPSAVIAPAVPALAARRPIWCDTCGCVTEWILRGEKGNRYYLCGCGSTLIYLVIVSSDK